MNIKKKKTAKEEVYKAVTSFVHNPENEILCIPEDVGDGIYYSKMIRIMCVIDERFDKTVDDFLSIFYAETPADGYFETYESDYGEVFIQKNQQGRIDVCFSEER